jgi:hypothetical protein
MGEGLAPYGRGISKKIFPLQELHRRLKTCGRISFLSFIRFTPDARAR